MARVVDVPVIVKEVHAKTILSKSKVFDYTVNPYMAVNTVAPTVMHVS